MLNDGFSAFSVMQPAKTQTPARFFTRGGGSLACYRVYSVSRRAVTFRVEGKQQMNIRSAATGSALARPRLGALDPQIISLESLI
jgi:hypothetical protein